MRGSLGGRCGVVLLALLPALSTAASDSVAEDEQLLRQAGVHTDSPALLSFFRQRTLTRKDEERVAELIRLLGDSSFRNRQKASTELVKVGTAAVPRLRQAAQSTDPETARRAEQCLHRIEVQETRPTLPAAAARLLGSRKPAGTAEVLLAYLPFVSDESVAEEVRNTLAAAAVRDHKPEPALLAGLNDSTPARRGAAAEALCRAGMIAQCPDVRRLLHDPEAAVRLQVSLALVRVGDREAVPVLIDLLEQLPQEDVWRVEHVLLVLGGEQAPTVPLDSNPATRKKYRDAWLAWWQAQGARVDLAKLEAPWLGYTLVVLMDAGKVVELDRASRPRWQIAGLQSPMDAQMLPSERVLITEFNSHRVTERSRKGDILWEKTLAENPIRGQRLANGNTFIATRQQLHEFDRAGKEVFHYKAPGTITTARKLHDGRIACVLEGGTYKQLDPVGKELKSFYVANVQTTSALDALPNGHLLLVQYGVGTILEVDESGRTIWEGKVSRPISAVRLPNGHTLASSQDHRLVELDRKGQIVWSHSIQGHPTQVRRR